MVNDRTTLVLQKALEGLALRQKAISNNIANADTPQYKARRVDFEQALRDAMTGFSQDDNHVAKRVKAVRPQIHTNRHGRMQNNGSNVDLEAELVALADTSLRHDALVEQVKQRLGLLRYVITEGRR